MAKRAANKRQTVADKETANRAKKAAAIKAKLDAGKTLNATEKNLLEKHEAELRKAAAYEYFERMPKKDFLEQTGSSSKVFGEWQERYGFPWAKGKQYLNAFDALRWLRDKCAGKIDDATATTTTDADAARLRKLESDADAAELKVKKERGELIAADEVDDFLRGFGNALREATEALRDRYGSDAASMVLDVLDKYQERAE